MALTTADEIRLDNYEFIDLFNDKNKKKIWTTMAMEAYKYTQGTQPGKGAGAGGAKMPPKRDDVAPHLALALEVSPDFNNSDPRKTARASYWFRLFADLIIDRTWNELGQP